MTNLPPKPNLDTNTREFHQIGQDGAAIVAWALEVSGAAGSEMRVGDIIVTARYADYVLSDVTADEVQP